MKMFVELELKQKLYYILLIFAIKLLPKTRALRYKLFFVKALTKRLRKLTIITKRL